MKKLSVLIFVSVFCLLITNPETQFAAVFPKSKAKIFVKKAPVKKTSVLTRKESQLTTKKLAQTKNGAQTALWQPISEESLDTQSRQSIAPNKYLVFRLSKTILTELLADVETEFTEAARGKSVIIELPMPDGALKRFRIEGSSVLEPDLAARFPEIRSYKGQGIDDPTLTTRFDWTPQGFHAMILSGTQTINVEPANAKNDASLYISYYGEDIEGVFECLVRDFQENGLKENPQMTTAPQIAVGPTLRNYYIAIATTFEYARDFGGGTTAGTIASLNTWLNGANLVYERELAVRLLLVDDTDVIYSEQRGFTATTDPYDNTSVSTMLNQVRPNLRDNVGEANYHLGHVLGSLSNTGGTGVAFIEAVCNNFNSNNLGPIKGGGATLLGGSTGNPTALGVWVHELGHQFGANHNFNGTQGNCAGGNRILGSSYESGSGSTIMGYSGICGADNITNTRDLRFHAMSYAAINNYIDRTNGGSCFIGTPTENLAPNVNGGGNRNIPKNTPFILTATASDPDGDSLMYNWEQIDAGGASYPQNGTSPSYNDAADPSTTTRSIFRPFSSSTSPSRTFPSLTYILNNANDPPDLVPGTAFRTAEELPRIGRTINFRITVRDNRPSGGGVNEDTVAVTVDGGSGPFLITAPNSNVSFTSGSSQTVSWSVNNTNAAPINAANVRISLSTDGGQTFPVILAESTPNDGSQMVTIPNTASTAARIKIAPLGNIFFDISNANFTITQVTTAASVFVSGRVLTNQNRGIRGVSVTMTDSKGASRTAITNSSGYFRFSDVESGATYTLEARAKNYDFTESTRVITVTEEIDDIRFVSSGRR